MIRPAIRLRRRVVSKSRRATDGENNMFLANFDFTPDPGWYPNHEEQRKGRGNNMFLAYFAFTPDPREFTPHRRQASLSRQAHQCQATSKSFRSAVVVQKQCLVGRSWSRGPQCSHGIRHGSVRWYHPRSESRQRHFFHRNQEIPNGPDRLSVWFLKHP